MKKKITITIDSSLLEVVDDFSSSFNISRSFLISFCLSLVLKTFLHSDFFKKFFLE